MILVTGATGHFGKATIDFLLQKGIAANNIAALVRDETKATGLKAKGIIIKVGDYDNYSSLIEAFKGVDKLLLVSGSDVVKRGKQQEDVVKAATEAGVKHIIYTSVERKNETATSPIAFVAKSHIDTENQIKASGIAYTILRNSLYMDYIPVFIGDKVLDTGVFWPAGDGKLGAVTRDEMAEAAANILTGTGHEGKDYLISNIENNSFKEVADLISKAAGQKVSYFSPTQEEYKAALQKAGVPATYIDMFAGFAEAIKQGEFESKKSDMQFLLGRKPTTLAVYLQQVYSTK
jgi:NAD(P)H dehydrogenase (quinone)